MNPVATNLLISDRRQEREMRHADWYFDYISPFPWIALSRFGELPEDFEVRPVPVVFAGLLKHWGHKGPVCRRERGVG